MKVNFYHEIINDHESSDRYNIIINVTIIREDEDDNLTFLTYTLFDEFMEDDECDSKEELNSFFIEARFTRHVRSSLIRKLCCFVADVTSSSDEFYRDSLLNVRMEIEPDASDDDDNEEEDDDDDDDDDDEEETGIERAVRRLTFNETDDNIESRPASQFAVNGLPRSDYEKNGFNAETCPICEEEFEDGQIVVSLPCEHDFHEECIVKWFETSHACPLCRFKLPF